MYIISDFHDYYDVGMKLGVDKSVVYNRKKLTVEGVFPPVHTHTNGWSPAVVAFCGKFYPLVCHSSYGKVDRIIWDLEEALATLPRLKWPFSWDDDRIDTDKGIKAFFDRKYPELDHLFFDHKTAIFGFAPGNSRRYSSWRPKQPYKALVINPSLKEIEFYKVKDVYTAFQDIYMFVSGVLGVESKPMIEISDKDRAAAKGHDGKYSFRKPPGKRGKKRWR